MMPDPATLGAILLMAIVTYATRIGGYLLLGDRILSPRMTAVMDAAPGCVLVSVIAPAFAAGRSADLIALVATLFAATRLPLLPTVLIGVASAAMLRFMLPAQAGEGTWAQCSRNLAAQVPNHALARRRGSLP